MHASVAEVSHVRRPEKRLRESGEVEHVRSGGLVFQKIRDAPRASCRHGASVESLDVLRRIAYAGYGLTQRAYCK